ncbi:MAG: branched-chain amino acid ABC transporter ATP-binding protein/permease [Neomegalonema sp.]|nr:branched-chain amino acid ABC transporter ATP-binding protein/permease [Neomegalonema sp.]
MEYVMHILVMVCMYAVLAISFNLLIGFAGLFALSQAVFFAIGAYATGLAAVAGLPFPMPEILAVLIGGIVGVLIALPALRTRGDYLVIVTLALQIVVLQVILNWKSLTGGTEGVRGIPGLSFFGVALSDPSHFLIYAAIVTALVFVFAWKVGHSPFGRAMKAMRENESAAQAVGKNLLYLKVSTFAVSAALAALAGSMFARYYNYVSVDSFSINETIYILAMVIVGGIGNLWGSVIGAAVLVALPELLKFLDMPTDIADQMRLVIYGVILILVLRFRPQGILPEPRGALHDGEETASAGGNASSLVVGDGSSKGEIVVDAKGLVKRFGGITAVSGFDIEMRAGQITGLIGPNGAGKTTAFNMLTGFLQPNEGSITLRGNSLLGLKPHRIVGAGVARSFQDLRLFRNMTVLDNVLVSLPDQAGDDLGQVFLRPAKVSRQEHENLARAMEVLRFVELDGKANETVNALSYAEEKLLVIARLLATGAEVMLFDEPLSGLDPTTLAEILPVIRKLADNGKVVCIIEHNLDVIKELSDVVYFLDEGRAMAVGTPEQVMTDPELAARYFK